jgi:hypothetical protein
MPASTKPSYTLSPHQPHTWSLHGKNGMLVSINMDTGETTFGEHYTPDEAARVFWDAIAGVVRWTKATGG